MWLAHAHKRHTSNSEVKPLLFTILNDYDDRCNVNLTGISDIDDAVYVSHALCTCLMYSE